MDVNGKPWSYWLEEHEKNKKIDHELGRKIEKENGDYTQEIINEIMLWKLSRYANLDGVLELLNEVKQDSEYDENLVAKMIEVDGLSLATASTILRFKNKNIYQIIDQRVYRFLRCEGFNLELKNEKIPQAAETYTNYLSKLKIFCEESGVDFTESDMVLYEVDRSRKDMPKLGDKNTFIVPSKYQKNGFK